MSKKHVVLSLSGGADSSSLLLRLLNDGYEVTALSFDIGQKHKIELERATELVEYLNSLSQMTFEDKLQWVMKNTNVELENIAITEAAFKLNFPKIKHQIIKLDGLSNLLVSGLIDNNSMNLEKGHYSEESAKSSVVPNRNAIFAAITYAVALSIVKRTGEKCQIALGTHMGDFNNKTQTGIYPDCSEEFRIALEHAFKIGNWDSEKVDYYAPYNITDKTGVIEDGIKCCKELGLDYKEIYKRTNTSYAPIYVAPKDKVENGLLLIETKGRWYSDYKSGSSIERIESFIKLGLEDSLQYAEEDGSLVSWDFVKEYVIKVCEDFKNSL
jgi:7-cyano-7-deazaguanine synthase